MAPTAALVLAATLACAPEMDRGDLPAVQVVAGVEYRAQTALLGSYPVRLRTWATAVNRGGREVLLRLPDDCAVLLRASSRAGAVRWDQGAAAACTGPPEEVRLLPGDSVVFETVASAPAILGDSLPDDVYVLTAYLRLGGMEIVLPAGRANLVGLPDTMQARR